MQFAINLISFIRCFVQQEICQLQRAIYARKLVGAFLVRANLCARALHDARSISFSILLRCRAPVGLRGFPRQVGFVLLRCVGIFNAQQFCIAIFAFAAGFLCLQLVKPKLQID